MGGRRLTTKEWIERAKEVHGTRYCYQKVEYINSRTNVIITCKVHGDFVQRPANHISDHGCPSCVEDSYATSAVNFTQKARVIHDGKYDYSECRYINNRTKVKIICNEHGTFEQRPDAHISGVGCPSCPRRYNEPSDLYILTNSQQIKVGYSNDVNRRLKEFNLNSPFIVEILALYNLLDTPTARAVEGEVHNKLKEYNAGLTGFDGATEWFNVTPTVAAETIVETLKEFGLPVELVDVQ